MKKREREKQGFIGKQKDDLDGVTIPTPYYISQDYSTGHGLEPKHIQISRTVFK